MWLGQAPQDEEYVLLPGLRSANVHCTALLLAETDESGPAAPKPDALSVVTVEEARETISILEETATTNLAGCTESHKVPTQVRRWKQERLRAADDPFAAVRVCAD